MIVRAAVRPGHRARLAAARAGAVAFLAVAGLSACAGSTPKVALPGSSATRSASASASASPSDSGSGTPTSPPPTSPPPTSPPPSKTATPTPAPTPQSHSARPPSGAPATGGGGTAGFQDPLLAGLGGAALLAGAGSLAYRRKILRNR